MVGDDFSRGFGFSNFTIKSMYLICNHIYFVLLSITVAQLVRDIDVYMSVHEFSVQKKSNRPLVLVLFCSRVQGLYMKTLHNFKLKNPMLRSN